MSVTQRELLARIDERTTDIRNDLTDLKKNLSANYATKHELNVIREEFKPTKKIVWTLVVAFLSALVAALYAIFEKGML